MGIRDAAWDAVWSVNVLGTRRLIEAAVPTMIANGKDANSRIVAVASAAGSTGLYHLAAYSGGEARGGWTHPRGRDGPGAVRHHGQRRESGFDAYRNLEGVGGRLRVDSEDEFAKSQPIGRLIEPNEVAATIAWLCSTAASAITGADIAVDGGMTVS